MGRLILLGARSSRQLYWGQRQPANNNNRAYEQAHSQSTGFDIYHFFNAGKCTQVNASGAAGPHSCPKVDGCIHAFDFCGGAGHMGKSCLKHPNRGRKMLAKAGEHKGKGKGKCKGKK